MLVISCLWTKTQINFFRQNVTKLWWNSCEILRYDCIVLYCTQLYLTALYNTYLTVLYSVLNSTALYYTVLYYNVIYCTTLYCIVCLVWCRLECRSCTRISLWGGGCSCLWSQGMLSLSSSKVWRPFFRFLFSNWMRNYC